MKKLFGLFLIVAVISLVACNQNTEPAKSDSGVQKASVVVQTDPNGNTVEQTQIMKRYKRDNTPGSIKYLYVISSYSGDVIIYSTVKGKVTSSGKRLTPTQVEANSTINSSFYTNWVSIGENKFATPEVIQDDGTYGSSEPYLYWFDTKDVYHQHYVSGGQIIHISDEPLVINKPIIDMTMSKASN